MKNLKLIIAREYNSRVRNKSFLIMTILSPIIFAGLIFLVAYLSSLNRGVRTIAVLDQSELFVNALEGTNKLQFTFLEGVSVEEAKAMSNSGEYYGLLYIPNPQQHLDFSNQEIEFFSKESPNVEVVQYIEKSMSTELTNKRLVENGVDLNRIESSKASIEISLEDFQGERTSKMSSWLKVIFGGVAGYFLMMFIIIYGNMVMRSVIEEKINRIIEIIISSVKPYQLMMGKIIGNTLAGLTQFLIWLVLGGILVMVAASVFGLQLQPDMPVNQETVAMADSQMQILLHDIARLPLKTLLVSFLIYFIGGYFLYSSLYAAIGAAVDNETDTQQFMFPIIMPLMLGMYVGFFSVIENPHGTVSVIFSHIPFTSPIVMLMRIPFGVAWWEILISMLILFVTFAGTVWIAAKIYRVGILMYGKKPTYKELIKWIKY
jgi:ABC-2 type transport system permease protein